MANDYTWLVLIEENSGVNVAEVLMKANGLYIGSGILLPIHHQGFLLSKQKVMSIISESIGQPINEKLVKRMELLTFGPGSIGDLFVPTWEVELKNGLRYYYSIDNGEVYGIQAKKNWKILKNGRYESHLKHLPPNVDKFGFDYINDQIVIFKKYPGEE